MKVQIGFSKLIVIVAILIAGQSFGQSSYVKLTDASGVGPSTSMLNELQEAADSLVSILPTEYMDDFKVYDFGFYQHLEDYDGFGYPEGFTAMLDKINTPYYLVFGRQTDQSGVNVKVWVEFKFDTQPFLCLDELELKNSIESRVIQLLNDGSNIYQCEFKILDEMLVRLQDGFCCSEALLKNGNNSYCANVDSLNVLSAMQCIQSSEHLTYLIEGFMTVYQFISKCNGTNWKTFVDGKGIIPHCLWDGKVYTKYIVGDIPFQCGVIDGLYQEIEELLKFTFSIYDIQAALRQAAIKLSLGYVECGIAESISPNQFCSVNGISVLEWKQACYTLRHDPSLWINMQYEYEMYIAWYDEVKPTESSFLWTNIDCDAVYRLQESIHMTYLALTCSETYVEAYEDIVNYTIGFWESVDGISNEERYLHGYYGVQVATLFIPFTKLKSLDDLYAYLNGLKNKISTQVDNYLGKVSQSMAPDLLNKVISKKQWYKELSISEKAKFELDFGNSAKALLWFNGNRINAWEKLFHVNIPQAIRTNTTYLSAASKQIENYGSQIAFQFDRVIPHVDPNKLDNFFAALDNPKSIDHVRSLAGDFENIPGINLSPYVSNSLPNVDIPAPGTWADPLLHLPGNAAETFTGATATTLSPGQKIYRVLGDGQAPDGGYWTYQLPSSKAELFGGTAVRPEWNAATHYVEYTVPSGGLKVWSGATARQPILKGVDEVNLPGGDSQLFIPDPYRQIGNEFENLPLNPMNW